MYVTWICQERWYTCDKQTQQSRLHIYEMQCITYNFPKIIQHSEVKISMSNVFMCDIIVINKWLYFQIGFRFNGFLSFLLSLTIILYRDYVCNHSDYNCGLEHHHHYGDLWHHFREKHLAFVPTCKISSHMLKPDAHWKHDDTFIFS